MAEQLTNDVYKPWMRINCDSLKIRGVDVGSPIGALSSINSFSSTTATGDYQLDFIFGGGTAFEIEGGNSFRCLISGVYAIDSNLVIGATTNNND